MSYLKELGKSCINLLYRFCILAYFAKYFIWTNSVRHLGFDFDFVNGDFKKTNSKCSNNNEMPKMLSMNMVLEIDRKYIFGLILTIIAKLDEMFVWLCLWCIMHEENNVRWWSACWFMLKYLLAEISREPNNLRWRC